MDALFKIASNDIVNAYNDCLKYAMVNEANARVYGFMANTSGTGAFAELAAESLAAYIRSVISGERDDVVNSFGFAPLNQDYAQWKSAHGYPSNFWYLTGTTRSGITARQSGDGYLTTLDESVSVPRIHWDGTQDGAFEISTIVGWLEEGTKYMPARPLISLASIRFLGVNYDRMKQEANGQITRWLRENKADANNYLRESPYKKTSMSQVASASPSNEITTRAIRSAVTKRTLPAKEKLRAKATIANIISGSGALQQESQQVNSRVRV